MHGCICTFFMCSKSTCFCTSHIVLSAGTSFGKFAYSTSTPKKLDHRLWSYCNVWQDRYWNFICITQPFYIERVWNIWIFHKVLTSNICCGMYARSIIMLICRNSRRWGDFIYYPPGWLWKRFHLNFSAILACRSFLCPGACTKTHHSLKQHQQKAFLQHQVDLVLWVLLVLLQWMPWRQSSYLYLYYVHMCHRLLSNKIPEGQQLLMSLDEHILVSSKFFLLLSPVPISMVVWRPRTVSLWWARTITSVSWVMICTLFLALEISAVCSMIRVFASSCVLIPVDGWTSFRLLFTCRRVTVTTGTFSYKTLFAR